MSKTTAALEAAVALVIENRAQSGDRQTARQRVESDRAFQSILKIIAPRIRHFIRQYGLVPHWDDAEQCCAIGVHRAIDAYDPTKAQFTTFVNWQLRSELQSLRFRLMTDQRPSAKKVEAVTISIDAFAKGSDGEDGSFESTIEDSEALNQTEAAASEHMAIRARAAIIEAYVRHLREVGVKRLKRHAKSGPVVVVPGVPRLRSSTHGIDEADLRELEDQIARHRLVAERRVFNDVPLDEIASVTGETKEQVRQMTRRVAKAMSDVVANNPRFDSIDPTTPSQEPPRRRLAMSA